MRARVHQLLVLLLGLVALIQPATARADSAVNAAAGMSMDVQVGYNGAVRLGAWVPVQVNVANDGPDLAGRVEVQFETGTSPVFYGPPPTVYSVPATFPQHSHKRLVVDVPMPPVLRTSSVQVRFVSGNQTVLQQAQPFTPISSGDLACGVLDQTLGSYDFLSSLTLPGRQQRTKVADLTVADLPSEGALLASLDCLVIGDVNLTSITETQKQALTTWVGNGGLLVVTGGVNWQQSIPALPPELLPVQVTGVATLTSIAPLDQFAHVGDAGPGPWPVALGSLQNGAIVAGSSSTPLLAVRRVGSGTVFFDALDPAQEPARSWAGSGFLWPYMLGFSNPPTATGYRQAPSVWGPTPITALGALPNLNPPPPTWLLLFLLAYGLLVGPIAFLLLRRADRLEWLLLFMPLAALIGTITTVRLAEQHQGSDIAATEVTLLRTSGPSAVAQVHTYIGLYAPRPTTIDLHVPSGSLFASVRRAFGQFGGSATGTRSTLSPLQISEGMDVLVPALQLDSGTLSTFTVDGQATLGRGITGSLTVDNQVVHGQVTNSTGQRITDAALVLDNTVHPLGTLKPNETRSVSMALPPSAVPSGGSGDTSVAARLYPPATSGSGAIEDPRRDVLDRVFSSSSFTDGNTEGGVMFVGWLATSPLHLDVRRARTATRQLTLLEAQLAITVDTATVDTIASTLMSERSLQSLGVTQSQTGHFSVASGGSLGVEYDLPSTPHFAAQTLHLLVDGGLSGGASLLPGDNIGTISAFNWSVNNWEPLPLVAGDNVYQGAGQLVSPTGQVRLRYSFKAPAGSTATGVDFTQFALSVAGHAA